MEYEHVVCELNPQFKNSYYQFYFQENNASTRLALHGVFDGILAPYVARQQVSDYTVVWDESNNVNDSMMRVRVIVRFDSNVVYTWDIDKNIFNVKRTS